MSMAALFGGLKYLPASLGVKALEKINPKFKNYFTTAAAYGIDATRALDYLNDRFESDPQTQYKAQLEKGAAQNTLRPDEMISKSTIANQEAPGRALRTLAGFGAGAALGERAQQPAPPSQPNLGQVQAPHVPGLGQVEAPNSPTEPRIEALKRANQVAAIGKNKRQMQKKLEEYYNTEYGEPLPAQNQSNKQDILAGLAQIADTLQRLKGGNG